MADWNQEVDKLSLGHISSTPSAWNLSHKSNTRKSSFFHNLKILLLFILLSLMLGILTVILNIWFSERTPRMHTMSIGITDYDQLDPHLTGLSDAEFLRAYFLNWNKIDEKKAIPRVTKPIAFNDALNATALISRIDKQVKEINSQSNAADFLLVYCSMHAVVRPEEQGGIGLIGIDAPAESVIAQSEDSIISLLNLMTHLSKTKVSQVVLCLDLSSIKPTWQSGILDSEITSGLKAGIEKLLEANKKFKGKFTILLSHDELEINSTFGPRNLTTLAPSNFAYQIASALTGKCDGFKQEARELNGRIRLDEFCDYLKEYVNKWSEENRGLKQNVQLFPKLTKEKAELVMFKTSGKEFNPEVLTTISQSPLTYIDDFEKAAADPKPDDKNKKTVATADKPQDKTNPPPEPTATAEKPAADPKAPPANPTDKPTTEQRLATLWNNMYEPEFSSNATNRFPYSYAFTMHNLAELQLSQLYGMQKQEPEKLNEMTEIIKSLSQNFKPQQSMDMIDLSLTMSPPVETYPKDLIKEFVEYREYLAKYYHDNMVKKPDAKVPTEAPPKPYFTPVFKTDQEKYMFLNWLFEDTLNTPTQTQLLKAYASLTILNTYLMPDRLWPAEIGVLYDLCEKYYTLPEPQDELSYSINTWKPLLDMVNSINISPSVFDQSFINQILSSSLSNWQLIQNWITIPGYHQEFSKPMCDQIRLRMKEEILFLEKIQQTQYILNKSLINFPDYAAWVAWSAELLEDKKRDINQQRWKELRQKMENITELITQDDNTNDLSALWIIDNSLSDQTKSEKLLLALWYRILEIRSQLASFDNSTKDSKYLEQINRLQISVTRLKDKVQELEQQLHYQFNKIIKEKSAQHIEMLVRAQHLKWLNAREREQLMKELAVPSTIGVVHSIPVAGDRSGLWYAFWGICVLKLQNLEKDDFKELLYNWDLVLSHSLSDDLGQIAVSDKYTLGKELAEKLHSLHREIKTSLLVPQNGNTKSQDVAYYSIMQARDFSNNNYPDLKASANPNVNRQLVLKTMAPFLVNNLKLEKKANRELSLRSRLESTLGFRLPENIAPEITRESNIKMTQKLQGELELLLQIPQDFHEPELTLSLENKNFYFKDNQGRKSPSIQVLAKAQASRIPIFTESAINSKTKLPVLLTSVSNNNILYGYHEFDVEPAFDGSQWVVKFFNKSSELPIRHQRDSGITYLYMLPTGEHQLSAYLMVPEKEVPQKVKINMFYLDDQFQPRPINDSATPLEFEIQPGTTKYPLPLTSRSIDFALTQPKTEAKTIMSFDLKNGFLIEIVTDKAPDKPISLKYGVRYWNWQQFIKEPPVPTTDDNKVLVKVTTQKISVPPNEDWMLPETVPIKVNMHGNFSLSKKLANLASPQMGMNDTQSFFFFLLDRQDDNTLYPHDFDITLDVANIPHAVRWHYDYRQPFNKITRITGAPVDLSLSLKSDQSPNAMGTCIFRTDQQNFNPVKLISNQIQAIRNDTGEAQTWELSNKLIAQEGQKATTKILKTWRSLQEPYLWEPKLTLVEGNRWIFTTSLKDFENEINLSELSSGKYQIESSLSGLDPLTNQPMLIKPGQLDIIIDNTPPVIQDIVIKPKEIFIDTLCTFSATAQDLESGISSMVIGLDMNGNGNLEAVEPQKLFNNFPKDNLVVSSEWSMQKSDLPERSTTCLLIVKANNQAGHEVISDKNKIKFQEYPKPVMDDKNSMPAEAKPGSASVSIKGFGNIEVSISGPKSDSESKFARDGDTISFTDLPVGKYKLKWKFKTSGKSGESSFEIKSGQAVNLNVP